MNSSLFDTAPDFDQPIAVLRHCHDRIRKQLRTLQQLSGPQGSAASPDERAQAASAVLRYFEKAAPNHHADEEDDLLPMLKDSARDADAALLEKLTPGILDEHRKMETLWQSLETQLRSIAARESATLDTATVDAFGKLYLSHMETEENHIAPMAKRLFSEEQMHRLGDAMRQRRGISAEGQA
jgi:pyridoxamine 5'-phosphate oxidase